VILYAVPWTLETLKLDTACLSLSESISAEPWTLTPLKLGIVNRRLIKVTAEEENSIMAGQQATHRHRPPSFRSPLSLFYLGILSVLFPPPEALREVSATHVNFSDVQQTLEMSRGVDGIG
jgi:hypothetical protein